MAMIFTQGDTGGAPNIQPTSQNNCCGDFRVVMNAPLALYLGSPGTSTVSPVLAAGDSNRMFGSGGVSHEMSVPAGTTWSSGSWTYRLNVTTSNMNLTLDGVYCCRINSSGVHQQVIGSATSLGISLSSTGVKSISITGAASTPAVGDMVMFILRGSCSAMAGTDSFTYTNDQDIDTPWTAPTPSFPPYEKSPYHHLLVRKVRDFFIGGLPPKLAKLSMAQNDDGLYVPQSLLKGV